MLFYIMSTSCISYLEDDEGCTFVCNFQTPWRFIELLLSSVSHPRKPYMSSTTTSSRYLFYWPIIHNLRCCAMMLAGCDVTEMAFCNDVCFSIPDTCFSVDVDLTGAHAKLFTWCNPSNHYAARPWVLRSNLREESCSSSLNNRL